ncbi:MAG: hypothetical protein Q4D26_08445 [Clostridia bacterium]|nr:hypothetical protein [Clostridia bacterium]
MKKKICKVLAIIFISGCITNVNVCAEEKELAEAAPSIAEESEYPDYYNSSYDDYIESIKDLPEDEYNYKLAMAPSKYSYNETVEMNNTMSRAAERAAAAYDNNMALSTQDQGNPYNSDSGWAFGVNNALEAAIYKNNLASGCNFSEQHLRFSICNYYLSDNYKSYGGSNGGISTAYFRDACAYWMRKDLNGPVPEKSLFYNINKIPSMDTLLSCEKDDYIITDTIELSSISWYAESDEINQRVDLLKSLVRKYGAVYVAYDHFDGGFNDAIDAYHNPNCEISDGKECANGVVIVGWDDNYSKSKFGECKPANDGAFIVKANRLVDTDPNSLDVEPRMLGRYFLSYEMTPYFYDYGVVSGVKKGISYEETFEYDKRSPKGVSYNNKTKAVYANKYNNTTGKPLEIRSITTYAAVPNTYFKMYVSTDGDMANLQRVYMENYITNSYMGYRTFTFEDPIVVDGPFIVAVEATTSSGNSEIIPQEKNPVEDSSVSGRCFVASTIEDMKNGKYTDQGSHNNIIKVHTVNSTREWYFGDSEFTSLPSILNETVNFDNGLTLSKGIQFRDKQKDVKGKVYTGNIDLIKNSDEDRNFINIKLDGPSNVYFIAQTNAAGEERRLSVYNDFFDDTGYLGVNESKGYCYKYREENACSIKIKAVDGTVRIYGIAVENYSDYKYSYVEDYTTRVWDFENVTADTKITAETESDRGLRILATESKPVRYLLNNDTNEYGYKFTNAVDLMGVGTDEYRSIAVDVRTNSNIYISARDLSNEGRELIITDKYGCDLKTRDNLQKVSVTNNCNTYKFSYLGDYDTIYIRSLSGALRIYQVAVTDYKNYVVDEIDCRFDNLTDYAVGQNMDGASIGQLSFEGGSIGITMCQSTSSDFDKAVKIYGNNFLPASKLKMNISSSTGSSNNTPARKIRIKAKSNVSYGKIVLSNQYGCVFGSGILSTDTREYVFDYNGDYETMYIYTTTGTTEIYSISTTDINYNSDPVSTNIYVKSGQTYRYLFNVENAPASNIFNYTIEYDPTKLKFVHIGKDNNFDGGLKTDNSITNVYVSNGKITFNIADPMEKDWSGIATSVVFEGIADGNSTIKFSASRKIGW